MQPFRLLILALSFAIQLIPGAAAELGRAVPGAVPQPGGTLGLRGLFQTPAVPPARPPAPIAAAPAPAPPPASSQASPGALCRAAISAAELRHGVPAGLMQAIGLVESGRPDAATGTRMPWPWAVNAEGRGFLFETREQAIAWVRQAEATGTRSIDTGCMQVNRLHHPGAFVSLEQAFDPHANADYAARFLRQLKEGPAGGDWMKAAGFYHSQTPERADPYRAKVQAAMGGLPAPLLARAPLPAPGGGGQFLGNRSEQASLLAAPQGTVGRGLDAYRLRPVPVTGAVPGLRVSAQIAPLGGARPSGPTLR